MIGIDLSGVQVAQWSAAPSKELYPGVILRDLWRGPGGARALILEFAPGATFTDLDEHFPGPEEVFVLCGEFGDGVHRYPAGSFIHHPAGSAHVPQSSTGCALFVFFPEG